MTHQEYRKKMIEKFEEWKQTQYTQAVGIVNLTKRFGAGSGEYIYSDQQPDP
jgi:homoserine kinase